MTEPSHAGTGFPCEDVDFVVLFKVEASSERSHHGLRCAVSGDSRSRHVGKTAADNDDARALFTLPELVNEDFCKIHDMKAVDCHCAFNLTVSV